jgi:RNA polymerase sigma-70 factor (ECF subfamily)
MPDDSATRHDSESGRPAQQDAAEAEQLVRDNIAWMLALAERMLRDRGLAEDVVQEAFVRALRGLGDFEGRSSVKTWLHRITVNASLTKLRQLKRLGEQPIDEYLPEFDRANCRVEAPWTYLASVQDVVENAELRACADLLQITEANVKVRLHRARAALKKLLEPILRGEVSK